MPKMGQSGKKVGVTNRGAAGLLRKMPEAVRERAEAEGFVPAAGRIAAEIRRAKKDRIAPALAGLAVDIASLVPDPQNARLHPEANLEAIRLSLARYGQLKPVVVRKRGRVVLAGNGTREAALSLGWTRLAATFVDLDDVAAAGYALADNRTAELARWDTEIVARLERLQAEAGKPVVGWSDDEVLALRMGGWVEPPDEFPEVGEDLEVQHECPRCGYRFSGGTKVAVNGNGGDGDGEEEA